MSNWIETAITPAGLFLGIVAGAIVQYLFHRILSIEQVYRAKKIFVVELEINKLELRRYRKKLEELKDRIAAGPIPESDILLDMVSFNYRGLQVLVNNGFFHLVMSPRQIRSYFEFTNTYNVDAGMNSIHLLRDRYDPEKRISQYSGSKKCSMSAIDLNLPSPAWKLI